MGIYADLCLDMCLDMCEDMCEDVCTGVRRKCQAQAVCVGVEDTLVHQAVHA